MPRKSTTLIRVVELRHYPTDTRDYYRTVADAMMSASLVSPLTDYVSQTVSDMDDEERFRIHYRAHNSKTFVWTIRYLRLVVQRRASMPSCNQRGSGS